MNRGTSAAGSARHIRYRDRPHAAELFAAARKIERAGADGRGWRPAEPLPGRRVGQSVSCCSR